MRSRLQFAVPRLYFPLARLALCADCEVCFEIGPDTCPACGAETWSPLSRVVGQASDDAVVRAVRAVVAETAVGTRVREEGHHLVIVSRDQPKLYEMIRRELKDTPGVTVVKDRRGLRPPPTTQLPNQRWRNVDRQIAAMGWAIVRADVPAVRR